MHDRLAQRSLRGVASGPVLCRPCMVKFTGRFRLLLCCWAPGLHLQYVLFMPSCSSSPSCVAASSHGQCHTLTTISLSGSVRLVGETGFGQCPWSCSCGPTCWSGSVWYGWSRGRHLHIYVFIFIVLYSAPVLASAPRLLCHECDQVRRQQSVRPLRLDS